MMNVWELGLIVSSYWCAIVFYWNKTGSMLLLLCYSLAVSAAFRQVRTVAREAIKLPPLGFVSNSKHELCQMNVVSPNVWCIHDLTG